MMRCSITGLWKTISGLASFNVPMDTTVSIAAGNGHVVVMDVGMERSGITGKDIVPTSSPI
jgi:hypothetical protein